MASSLLFLESANLFVGDEDPTDGKHLTLEEVQLPSMEEVFQDHNPGGADFGIDVAVGKTKMSPTFKLKGIDPQVFSQFGLGTKRRIFYTMRGLLRDQRTGGEKAMKAIFEGRLGKASPEAWKRGELTGSEYAINEVVHYELYVAEQEIYFWDFFTSTWRVNGTDENAATKSILGIA